MRRPVVLWILAAVITLASVVYQRLTGPTYAVRGSIGVGEEVVGFRLPRSHDITSDANVKIRVPDRRITGEMHRRRFRSNDPWDTVPMERQGEDLVAAIPRQPPAGKVIYQIALTDGSGLRHALTNEPVIIRFKGPVPLLVLIPHVVLMFTAMLIGTRSGLEALARGGRAYRLTIWTTIALFLGGMILGPIVQKYAFGAFWTGWPFGHDLTDTKTAVVMLFWLVALWRGRHHAQGRVWIMIAALALLSVYLIPHSLHGSELDYTTGV